MGLNICPTIGAWFVKKRKGFHITRITQSIESPVQAEKFFRKIWDKDLLEKQEQVYAIFVDEQNRIIEYRLIHTGGVCEVKIDTRILFTIALECKADGMFIAHNHPKGELEASDVDIETTDEIKTLCLMLGMKFYDHTIITKSGYRSFAESGLLD